MVARTFDNVTAKLTEIAESMGEGSVRVGFMEGATYPDGTPVAAVAYWNEFGGPNRPPRPFFRKMISAESPTWAGKLATQIKSSNYDGDKALARMGEDIGGGLVQSIRDFTTPALAMRTILARASGEKHGAIKSGTIAKPLIDTAHMLNSVSYQVDDGEVVPIKRAE